MTQIPSSVLSGDESLDRWAVWTVPDCDHGCPDRPVTQGCGAKRCADITSCDVRRILDIWQTFGFGGEAMEGLTRFFPALPKTTLRSLAPDGAFFSHREAEFWWNDNKAAGCYGLPQTNGGSSHTGIPRLNNRRNRRRLEADRPHRPGSRVYFRTAGGGDAPEISEKSSGSVWEHQQMQHAWNQSRQGLINIFHEDRLSACAWLGVTIVTKRLKATISLVCRW